jgi:hypothetical protein
MLHYKNIAVFVRAVRRLIDAPRNPENSRIVSTLDLGSRETYLRERRERERERCYFTTDDRWL